MVSAHHVIKFAEKYCLVVNINALHYVIMVYVIHALKQQPLDAGNFAIFKTLVDKNV